MDKFITTFYDALKRNWTSAPTCP